MKDKIKFDEFLEIEKKLEIKAGKVLAAERIPKSKKLLKLLVAFDEDLNDYKDFKGATRVVVTNLGDKYEPEFFIGKITLFITNLEPSTMMGVVSEAMILPGVPPTGELEFRLYTPGTKIL
jgi:methionyl-tRNA synthetase